MGVENFLKYTRGKTKIISLKVNPELLKKLDTAIKGDKEIKSRNGFFELCMLKYLEGKGKL